jgi:uncharacterized protein (DUF433 family)
MSIWNGLTLVDDSNSDEPRLSDSGVDVWALIDQYDCGASSDQIAQSFRLPLKDVQSVLTYAHRYLPETDPIDWIRCEAVERVPGRCGGEPVMRGTRMPVSLVMDNFDSGVSIEEFAEDFELDAADVAVVFGFIAKLPRLSIAS